MLEINPDDWQSGANLAQLHAEQGRHRRAITHYRDALAVGEARLGEQEWAAAGFAAIHFGLAESLMEVGQRGEAMRARAAAIELDPRYRDRRLTRPSR